MPTRTTSLPSLWNEAYADCYNALHRHFDVPDRNSIFVLYNQSLGGNWGNARIWKSGNFTRLVKLSKELCQNTSNNAILNTMIHELVHCCGIWNHGRNFKLAAAIINNMFPGKYNVSRCTSVSEKMTSEQMNNAYKYLIQCPKCKTVWGFKFLSKKVREAEQCWCCKCSKGTDKVHLVRVK